MQANQLNYKNVNENPCHMCMPMGAILPFKGVEQSMVMLHGSQGCSTYMRRHIAEHFNEPIDVGSSSLNEKGTIYGGESNLKQGLRNLIKLYNPRIIGVLTTCLSETIGEDIEGITNRFLAEENIKGVEIITVGTPGYGGSHEQGYWMACRRIVERVARQASPKNGKLNVVVPNISTADIREIKRMLELMEVEYILLPDISDTLDRPFNRPYTKIPSGGTRQSDIANMAGAVGTIQFGITAEANTSPGEYLNQAFGVPLYDLPLPIGLENTNMFLKLVAEITKKTLPDVLRRERGRLLDAMIDSHKYNAEGRAVLFGDVELVYAVTILCLENGLQPAVVSIAGKPDKAVSALTKLLVQNQSEGELMIEADFASIRARAVAVNCNIAIGHSDGRCLEEREGIPLVRIGFPIHDRVGGQRLLSVGYTGTTMLLDRITNTLLEQKHRNYRTSIYSQFYKEG